MSAAPSATSSQATASATNSNTIALVAWLLSPLSSIFLVLVDTYKKDKLVQFHAWQSLYFGILAMVLDTVLFWACGLPILFHLGVVVYGMVKAYKGEMFKLPVIGDWAEAQALKAVAEPVRETTSTPVA